MDIFIRSLDGGIYRNMTVNLAANSEAPAWSPDGQRIAFLSDRDGSFNLYIMKADGTDVRHVTHTPGLDESATVFCWFPACMDECFGCTMRRRIPKQSHIAMRGLLHSQQTLVRNDNSPN
jgi:hypothetical protein